MRNSALKALGLALLLLSALPALAQEAGIITHLSGTLTAKSGDGPARLLSIKSNVKAGETLATLDNTYARLKFNDGGEVVLRPNSQFAVSSYTYDKDDAKADNFVVGLVKGGMRMVTGLLGRRNPERVSINTPTATIGIRGTHFGLLICQGDCANIPTISGQPPADGLHIDVADGLVAVTNSGGEKLIGGGQFGYVRDRVTPPEIVPASQGIQVTMPPSISQNNAAGRSVGQSRQESECAVQ